MRLPESVTPMLNIVRASIRTPNTPIDFWLIDDGEAILDGFMELASLLRQSSLDENILPRGYSMLAHLFNWEADCQFDGWGAFGNISTAEFQQICKYFVEVGLAAEAESLLKQMETYVVDPDNIEALIRSAETTRHSLSIDLDRLEYLTQFFCDHAEELLYEHT